MIKDFAKKISYEVPEVLQSLVVGFILGKTEEPVKETVPMYPSGYSLLFQIYGDIPFLSIDGKKQLTRSRFLVAGQICDAKIEFHITGILDQVGVILYPTASYYLFHNSGDYFLNTWRSLKEASPICIKELKKELAEETSTENRILCLINFLKLLEKHRLQPICWLEDSLKKIFSRNGNISQRELIKDAGLSERHYRRIFKKVIGVSPKYFCKIIQLSTVFELLNNAREEKIHHLALDCGYYDQSHFIRNFQKLIGNSPENFLNSKHAYLKTYMGRRGELK